MGKRKRAARPQAKNDEDDEIKTRKASSINKIQTWDDVELDDEDQCKFAAQRDIIRFDTQPEQGSHSFLSVLSAKFLHSCIFDPDDDIQSDEEVLPLDLEQDDADTDLDEDNLAEDDEHLLKLTRAMRPNAVDSDEDDEDRISKDAKDDASVWGKSRSVYYDADDVSDDEEKAKEEEDEALRIQRQRVSRMREEDYMDDFTDSFKSILHQIPVTTSVNIADSKHTAIKSDHADLTPSMKKVSKWLSNNTENHPNTGVAKTLLMNIMFYTMLKGDPQVESKLLDKVYHVVQDLQNVWEHQKVDVPVAEEAPVAVTKEVHVNKEVKPAKSQKRKEKPRPTVLDIVNQPEQPDEEFTIPVIAKIRKSSKRTVKNGDDVLNPFEVDEVEFKEREASRRISQFLAPGMDVADIKKSKKRLVMTGDQDIPYRDPKTGRVILPEDPIATANANKSDPRLKQSRKHDLEIVDSSPSVSKVAKPTSIVQSKKSEYEEDGEEYYEALKASKIEKKAKRSFNPDDWLYDDATEEVIAADGKRGISWNILTNKGLTPKRKKEQRNPRVKKRKRFETAMKRLSSFRRVAVDKSKVGAYGGEATGIKSGLVRSIKFS
ncbi:hypothetical protein SmJEL517_g04177 [Synchytrium microbalum]|uniref:Sas10 C-terminal domain-containing protein n=1 Tax=Synchytrium microbalum TaxID=1806994 RepID=A0A507C487_9FUNG|nr:uncharacterized protein SmJEL517_g04177 [Synchytrium microbalum]TPX32786.1 hypothetical protein SmJEL517_g04177 [Synchytrium microbalum]